VSETDRDAGLLELFEPDSVAVVGGTPREGSVGRGVVDSLRGFEGDVVVVNPNHDEVLGFPSYKDVDSVPGEIDLAVVAVPPKVVVGVVEELGDRGVANVVVVTAGFSEAGGDGAERERELIEAARRHSLNLVGPNCIGVVSTPSRLNATFGPESPQEGNVSFMSQSGAFITAAVDWANDEGMGFRHIVSLGNKAVLDETDFVEAWGDDDGTNVVVGYLEGIEDGSEFIETARRVTREGTPVVLVKSGRTEAGARAVSSHTGTLAGTEKAYEAAFRKAGIVRADDAEELFDLARALESLPLPDEDGVAVVTNAGGPGVMATDAVGDSSLTLAEFEDTTYDALRDTLPDAAAIYNPVDVLGDAAPSRFGDAVGEVLEDPNVGACLVIACPTATFSFDALAETVVETTEGTDVPVVAALMGGEGTKEARETLSEGGVPSYFDPARGVRSLDAVAGYRRTKERETGEVNDFDVDREKARSILETGREDGRLGVEAMSLLDAYGVPTPTGEVIESPEAAERVADEIGDDVVMKIVSPDILHKSDIGGVKVGVARDDVRDAYEDLVSRARSYQPDAELIGVQVQETVEMDEGVETIVGFNRDPQFGPLVMFGLGGVFVEVFEDTSFGIAPVTDAEAREMVESVESSPLLRGARGREPVDVDSVVETVERVSALATDFPAVLELDINPLVATPEGVSAVDLRLTLDPEEL
jgi:acetyltransferase